MQPLECLINTTLISIAVLGSAFVLLLDLKINGIISVPYSLVFMPWDLLLGIFFLSVCFIVPGYLTG